jgi:putative peptidoglycan lipid II flippase
LFQGGRFTAADAEATALVLSILVAGLPAYVLVKVLTPGFYARKDMKTPVQVAIAMLVAGVVLNFLLLDVMGLATLPFATALTAWGNALLLYGILHARGHFRVGWRLTGRLVRQIVAAAAMGAALWWLGGALGTAFAASGTSRAAGLIALVATGGIVYFGVAFAVGALDRDMLALLRRRKPAA